MMQKKTINDFVYEDLDAATKDFKSNYSNVTSTSNSKISKYCLSCYNFDQTDLNKHYNFSPRSNTVDGTCSEVAMVSLIEYYNRKGYMSGTYSGYYATFRSLMEKAYDNKAFPNATTDGVDHGTLNNLCYKVINSYYKDKYNKNVSAQYKESDLYNTIIKYNNNAKPVLGHFSYNNSGHCMIITGVYKVTVKYKTLGISRTAEKVYYSVCDGWKLSQSGGERVQYIEKERLDAITYIK